MNHSPRFRLEVVAEAHGAASTDNNGMNGERGTPQSHEDARRKSLTERQAGQTDVATDRQDAMSLRHDTRCIIVAQQVEDIGRDNAIKPPVWLVESRQAGCLFDNGPICPRPKSLPRDSGHGRADVDPNILGVVGDGIA